MIKTLTSYLDYGLFAEISVVIFAAVFVAIVIRTLLTQSEITSRQASIVIGNESRKTEQETNDREIRS